MASSGNSLKVLLVEDNPADAELTRERLNEVPGYSFDFVHSFGLQEALAVLAQRSFDAAILDLDLPDSNGLSTLEQLRAMYPRLPIIVLSGADERAVRDRVLSLGALDYLAKHESASRLMARSILYAIQRHRAQEHDMQIEKLIDATPDAVIVTDKRGIVRFVNDAAEVLFGRPRDSLVGDLLGFSVAEGGSTDIEVWSGGVARTAEMRVVDVDWHGQPSYLAALRDTTDQRRISDRLQQTQKLEAIGRLAGGIAHDFNNLLTVIVTYAGFIREELGAGDPRRQDVAEVLRAADHARQLTMQLLAFSRRQPVEMRVIDVNALVTDLHRMLRRTLGEDIELVVIPDEQLWHVRADSGQLEQVLMNLAVNARDAMPEGGKITIETENVVLSSPTESLTTGRYVCVRMHDTGMGMEKHICEQIFEPFFTTKEKGKGTGLGLATCYGITRQLGGDIAVESQPRAGTTFTIWLPQTEQSLSATPQHEEELPRKLHGAETVLVVEDDGPLRRSTARILREHGYTVFEAANGEEAVRIVGVGEPTIELVVTDVVMPHMGGRELALRLETTSSNVKVLYMTGYSDDPLTTGDGSTSGAKADIIYKPFMPGALLRKVRHVLDRHSI